MQKNTHTILTTKPRTFAWFSTLALAILFLLAACGDNGTGNNPTPTAAPPSPTATTAPSPTSTTGNTMMVTVTTNSSGVFTFSPTSLTVAVGTTVIWKNGTQAPHTVTSDDGSTFNGMLNTGGTFSFTFTKAGTFPYHCNIHPFMKATIIVQ